MSDNSERDSQKLAECIGIIYYSGDLFHGTAAGANTLPDLRSIDYRDMFIRPLDVNIDDATLGAGLYLCADRSRAEEYGRYKTRQHGNNPLVITITANNIPLYDFRDKMNPQRNADVPLELAQDWQQYYAHNRKKILEFCNNDPNAQEELNEYERFLDQFVGSLKGKLPFERGFSLQSLLATLPGDPSFGMGCVPLWGGLFPRFMQDIYYVDGIIANQGGEDETWSNGVTYVITNLTPGLLNLQKTERI